MEKEKEKKKKKKRKLLSEDHPVHEEYTKMGDTKDA
tara:strand:- start:173 stop:280 length:108 start_codon:yes stop_codon:yes gene_type:complete